MWCIEIKTTDFIATVISKTLCTTRLQLREPCAYSQVAPHTSRPKRN